MLELVGTFLLVGASAFGGGQAALPLVERLAVGVHGWVTPAKIGTAVGLSYATFEREAFAAENTPLSDPPAAALAAPVGPDVPPAGPAGGT